ncbi:F-box/WD repeat-containing protein 7 [Xenopus tropicalis]|uniref:F-box/WD repeat-containing protein 7 n=1 Tax=Xenopus tropicalis TaxID=8364 RepID=A0A8J1JGU9_XENTR|nr:F-box/WD repeat-containing protein 7 [Xenopus tropicalis]
MGCARQSRMEAGEPQDCTSWLPDELALRILSYLDAKDILQVAQTCQRWRELAEDEGLWQGKCKADGIEEPPHISTATGSRPRPWKSAYTNQLRVDTNWRRGRFRTITLNVNNPDFLYRDWDFDGKEMVCLIVGKTIEIWSAVTGECLRTLVGHTDGVASVQIRGHMIVSGSWDQTLKVWNAESGECIHTLGGHTDAVWCMYIHEKWVASGSRDGTIRVWDSETGRCLHILSMEQNYIVYIRYDGRRVFSIDDHSVLKVWDQETQSFLLTFPCPIPNIRHFEFNGAQILAVTRDGAITVWDRETGQRIRTITDLQDYIAAVSLRANALVSGDTDPPALSLDFTTKADSERFHRYAENMRLRRNFALSNTGFGPVPLWDLSSKTSLAKISVDHFIVSNAKLVCLTRNLQEVKVLVLDFGERGGEEINSLFAPRLGSKRLK